jgi:hypothetical protein
MWKAPSGTVSSGSATPSSVGLDAVSFADRLSWTTGLNFDPAASSDVDSDQPIVIKNIH